MTKLVRSLLVVCLAAAALPATASAQRGPPDLALATLEELMDIRVTSAARKSQRAEDVPAAIYVITRSDIRQSGLMTLPEILRLAPGVQVAQLSSSKWAVSIRGFNDLFSNKLLVLIDGRSVYNRTFSGVLWELQDVIVPDIDRIEVIRGPGGVAWGANAVNGVINVITRPATETQGLDVAASVGTFARAQVGLRYGGTVGGAAYRLFSQWSAHDDSKPGDGLQFADNWRSLTSGARLDWARGATNVMAQGHFTTNRTRPGWLELTGYEPGLPPTTDGVSHGDEASVLGRWTRTMASGGVLQVQGYHTTMRRDDPIIRISQYSSDVDAQYETSVGARHSVVLGSGYRHVSVAARDTLTVQTGSSRTETFNLFLQDEIAIRRGLALTLGSKVEYDTLGGWGVLPSVRLFWAASPDQRVWVAASRARRTPSTADRDLRINVGVLPGEIFPIVVGLSGNPDYHSEGFVQFEAGYRIRLGATVALDTTAFTGSYDGLPTTEPIEPIFELTPAPAHILAGGAFENLMSARMSGVEVNARWNPLPQWRVETSYSFLHLTGAVEPGSLDPAAADTDGNSPSHQWNATTAVSLRPGVEVSASLWRVGRLRDLVVPAYTRLDARAEFRLSRRLTFAAVAQNILHGDHQEFASETIYLASRVRRSARLDLRWAF
jgi:iron complex outermembrane receptor protein